MKGFSSAFSGAMAFSFLAHFLVAAAATHSSVARAISLRMYSRAHSLDDSYQFEGRDGWETVNSTDLSYKYNRLTSEHDIVQERGSSLERRASKKHKTKASSKNTFEETLSKAMGKTHSGGLDAVFKGLQAIGKIQKAIITWYTGHDLLHPSCWANTDWAPTDESFVAALTLEGWADKPKCFQFLELCNGPKHCVFVRVVDTCAGCARGSKHVDLTRAAFKQLADWDIGILNVQMRVASQPDVWHEELWGPKAT